MQLAPTETRKNDHRNVKLLEAFVCIRILKDHLKTPFAGMQLSSENGTRLVRGSPADGMRVWDEHGNYMGETDEAEPWKQPRKTFTPADRKRAKKKRDSYHTRAWYAKQLLAVAEGKSTLTKEQYHALVTFGRMRGSNRRPPKG